MINPLDLTGKRILVTGASSGIGRETCQVLSQLGARVILVARRSEKLGEVAQILEGNGHVVESFDLCRSDEIPQWVSGITKSNDPLDGVVHCAGIDLLQPIKLWNSKQTDELFRINLNACFALAKGLRQKSAHRLGASLVFVSSAAGIRGNSGRVVYSASKAAVIGLTKSLALELVRDGIRVNCVAPGMVETEMLERTKESVLTAEQLRAIGEAHPLGFGKARDVAYAIAFLLAESSRWITGTNLVVDGGYSA